MSIVAIQDAKSIEIDAVIIRADGSREYLGSISFWHKNPLRMLWWKVKRLLKGIHNGNIAN